MKVTCYRRPMLLISSPKTGSAGIFGLSSVEAQRVIDTTPVVRADAHHVELLGDSFIVPATRGGGPAFCVEKDRKVRR